ncbi:pilus (MSHA type) biogenesis protein MshL [Marinobacter halophilus]|uniref:Pilus (MSHA type) biogenesis protein MshL n=2 Tax=Marinobacter halophilus TaxID=1323740 RepID=A0A2T1KGM1_9GAMM|nr:pilus (MSHA type) biogenesis protein MshL [Marinobacter halophilus]PSF09200.1 pilus (MSHA type) biogenesis protein MshL [Marinobacter halophilus]
MTIIKPIAGALLSLALAACSNNPLMRSATATSSDVADQIDQTMQQAEQHAAARERESASARQAAAADISSQLLPPLASAREQDDRFDVNARGISAAGFFEALVEGTRFNVVVHPGVATMVDLRLNDVTVPEVMDIAADLYGLDIQRNGRLFRVAADSVQTQLFPIDYLHFKRRGGSETRVSSGQVSSARGSAGAGNDSGDAETRNLIGTTISTETESDFWRDIHQALTMVVGADGQVVVNPGAGLVMVRAGSEDLRVAEDYLRRTELIMQRQVVLEAKILEVTLNEGYQQGINWADLQTNSAGANVLAQELTGQAIRAGDIGGLFSATITEGNFAAVIQLLGQQGNVQILSSPRISTINNQKAVIKVGTDEFFVTDIDFDDNNSAVTATDRTSTSVELTPFFSGISLDVTPQISESGAITLHVHPSVSEVNDQQKVITIGERDVTLPLARSTVRETDSVIRAESGQIVVIGGLIQDSSEDSTSAVPFFSDIPLLGELFKQRRFESRKSELVILIRPVVANAGQMQADIRASRERMNVLRDLLNSADSVQPQAETAPR